MRAAVIREVGALPEPGELPDPKPADGEVLLDVRAGALNPIDVAIASGRFYAGPPEVPYAPGREGVGVMPDGRRVRFERDVGYGASGSLAERVVVAKDALISLPDEADDTVAAALGVAGLAAWLALGKANVADGIVVVLGATGAVGQVAVQAAKVMGARRVVAAARNRDALRRAEELGADATVVIDDGDFAAALKGAASGEVDAIIDPLWGAPAVAALSTLKIGGRLVHLGTSAGLEATIPSAPLRGKNVSIVGHSNLTTPNDVKARAFLELLEHVTAGRITVHIDVFSLDRVADAWREQASSPHRKLVVSLVEQEVRDE